MDGAASAGAVPSDGPQMQPQGEMAQLLQMLTQATAAALGASSRTAGSVQEAVRSDKRSALARLVKTPESFKYDNHKDEVKYFPDWLWNFRRWLEASDSEYAGELDAVEAEQNKTRVNSDMRPETAERSVALYTALGTLVQGRAQRIVRSVQNGSGYEAYRLLISNFMPANKQRAVALLQHICTYPIFPEKIPLEESILAFEALLRDYEKAAGAVCPQELSLATLLRCAPQAVRQLLYLRMNEDGSSMTYPKARDLLLNYDKANVVWKGEVTANGLTIVSDTRDDPMEVDQLRQQRKGDKGKGKGKWEKGGKGKGKGKGDGGKGKGLGKSDSKGKSKGKGKQERPPSDKDKTCFNCGKPGHISRDCWAPRKSQNQVRQVDQQPQQQQHQNVPTTNAAQNPRQQQSGTGSTNGGGAVRQIFTYDISTPRSSHDDCSVRFFMDSCGSDSSQIRMISDESFCNHEQTEVPTCESRFPI